MSALQTIADRLREHHPSLFARMERNTITVEPRNEDGFTVWLCKEDSTYIVGFDGWHEHFDSEEDALNCFTFGFSERCRLKVVYRGSFAHRWTLESKTDDGWCEDSTTGLLVFPFWRRPRTVYRTNGRTVVSPGD
jgi:hypothetical protein